ncbi:hypothetical protein MUN82_08665 [Hymenobacter aerilatus]|uniref:Uncharacterized protein n=1 Tax=Hymenobacter aerilatus TaxID=2932251 RepID=A0A8T9SZ63_9BACT|nr:hypothetical protein [Hymenobacter aerilatus]UOR07155.1 hypothetical protein MUN82_08665 [Hymenobacter aerilatus]
MRPFLEKKIAAQVAPVLGQSLTQSGTLPSVAPEMTNEGLRTTLLQQLATNQDLYQRLLAANQMMVEMGQLVATILGGDHVAASLVQLVNEMDANLKSDKATAADVLLVKNQLTSVLSQLLQKADVADLAAKANATTVQAISTKLNTTADGLTSVQNTLPTLATTSALTTATSTVQSAVDTQKARVDTLVSTTVPAVQSAIDTQKGRVDTIVTTTVPALQTDVNKRLLREGDTATGQIKGPVADASATGKTAYPRFEQVLGGINQPARIAQNVGSTSVALDPLTDTTGLNRKVMPVNVIFLLSEMPPASLLGSITLKIGTTAGGSDVYSKSVSTSILLGLLNKLTAELPTTALQLNPGTILYATATPSSGTNAGKWVAYVLSVFIPNAS